MCDKASSTKACQSAARACRSRSSPAAQAPAEYLLHLADNALVLGQRNAQWCGHVPILEEDLAQANISLDLIGQARLLYDLVARRAADGSNEDSYAYFRDAPQFRNYTLLELPHRAPLVGYAQGDLDYAITITRNFLYSALMAPLWQQLCAVADPDLAAIAGKSLKEASYHLRHSRRAGVAGCCGVVMRPPSSGAGPACGRGPGRLRAPRRRPHAP